MISSGEGNPVAPFQGDQKRLKKNGTA